MASGFKTPHVKSSPGIIVNTRWVLTHHLLLVLRAPPQEFTLTQRVSPASNRRSADSLRDPPLPSLVSAAVPPQARTTLFDYAAPCLSMRAASKLSLLYRPAFTCLPFGVGHASSTSRCFRRPERINPGPKCLSYSPPPRDCGPTLDKERVRLYEW